MLVLVLIQVYLVIIILSVNHIVSFSLF